MKLVKHTSIIIPVNRQRTEFDPVAGIELMESIEARGLLHAIVTRDSPDNRGNGDNLAGAAGSAEASPVALVAGERRLRAIGDLYALGKTFSYNGEPVPTGYVPTTTLGELSPLAALEAEYEENVRRRDFTWQEHVRATKMLADLRTAQATDLGKPAPTVSEIAQEVLGRSAEGVRGTPADTVRKELIVAANLDKPEVAKAKTMADAYKVLHRMDTLERHARGAIAVGQTFGVHLHKAHHADYREIGLNMAAGTVDVHLCDPPYGIDAQDNNAGTDAVVAGAHKYDDSYETWQLDTPILASLMWITAKEQAHAYVFCDFDRFHELKGFMQDAGWRVHRTPIIWYKPNGSRLPWPGIGPQRKHEYILFAVKGNRPALGVVGDVVTAHPDPNLTHGAQKPVALYSDLLRRSVWPGNTVADFCMGTGTIFPAAHALKCAAIGVECDAAAYGIAVERLRGLDKQGELKV